MKKTYDISGLTPLQRKVTLEAATEPPFANEYWNNQAPGLYVDVTDGTPLFTSMEQFDSGCGWPSFSRPIESGDIVENKDLSHRMVRIEVRSKASNAHLGHLFPDGPKAAGGMRYCINSASLRFIPVDRLVVEGYAEYVPLFAQAGSRGNKR